MTDIKIGDLVYFKDVNNRVYKDKELVDGCYYVKGIITKITHKYYHIDYRSYNCMLSVDDLQFKDNCLSFVSFCPEEAEGIKWLDKNRYKIIDILRHSKDYSLFKTIEKHLLESEAKDEK